MADDSGVGLILAALIDVLLGKAEKRHRWVRVLGFLGGLLFVLLIALAAFVTVKYS